MEIINKMINTNKIINGSFPKPIPPNVINTAPNKNCDPPRISVTFFLSLTYLLRTKVNNSIRPLIPIRYLQGK